LDPFAKFKSHIPPVVFNCYQNNWQMVEMNDACAENIKLMKDNYGGGIGNNL
jgi:hypothetical protein